MQSVYKEALDTTTSVSDFSLVFDVCVKLKGSLECHHGHHGTDAWQ